MPDAAAKTVAQCFAESMAHHARYRQCSEWPNQNGQRDVAGAVEAIRAALASRREAEALDPERTDAAWRRERIIHDDMVRFYTGYLERADLRAI